MYNMSPQVSARHDHRPAIHTLPWTSYIPAVVERGGQGCSVSSVEKSDLLAVIAMAFGEPKEYGMLSNFVLKC